MTVGDSATSSEKDDIEGAHPEIGIPDHDRDTYNGLDLEKQETIRSRLSDATNSGAVRQRVTRTQSLTGRATKGIFTHPLAHIKTTDADIVDFDGPDDPYKPGEWVLVQFAANDGMEEYGG
jgi:hypothetical protein